MNITGNDNYPANVRVIDDGDACSNAEHGATAQDNADRATYTANTVPGVGTSILTRVPLNGFEIGAGGNWWFGANGNASGSTGALSWMEHVVTTNPLYFALPVPPRGTIISFTAHVKGNIGSGTSFHGAKPATLPKVELVRSKLNPSSALEILDSFQDVSADLAAYEPYHALSKTLAAAHTLDPLWTYYLRVHGESGANSTADAFGIFGLECTFGRAP